MKKYMRKFYRHARVQAIVIDIILLAALIFVLAVSETEVKIAMSFFFVFGIAVSSFLLKYYKNFVADVSLDEEAVCILLSDDRIFRYDRAECIGIEKFSHLIKLHFKDGKVFSMPKYFTFKKFDFDFSIFNQSNFPNAKIENRI